MILSIQDELLPFAEELQRYVTPVFLEELARELGFVKRKNKFSGSDLDQMDQRGTYYISRLKLNTNVYVKNPDPEYFKNGAIKKQSEYIQIDVKQLLNQLQPGETFELKHAYIGDKQQLFARVIFNRLTEKHPRSNKDSNPPIPPTTEKQAEISSI